jgi:uncharacterized protein YijF (DUF1287 family)
MLNQKIKKGNIVLKKFAVLTPLIIISISMTACSSTKNHKVITTQKNSIIKKPSAVISKQPKIIPVVYEKRSPTRTRKHHRRRAQPRSTVSNGSFANKLSNAALGRLRSRVRYDGSYVKIAYPWGDVPQNMGVCTDVVIRSYRKLGIDLQQQVHQDMTAAFNAYPNPKKWGLSKPDTNIDHRRVYNLRQFFARRGASMPITRNPADYRPGDLVTWMVGKDLPHIGVVVNKRSRTDPSRHMIVHNIAYGPQMEDVLFRFPISGHYRYTTAHMGNIPKATYVSNKRSRRTTTPRGMSRTDAMNYAQLVEAATVLNSTPVVTQQAPKKSSKQSMQIATLSELEVEQLLGTK